MVICMNSDEDLMRTGFEKHFCLHLKSLVPMFKASIPLLWRSAELMSSHIFVCHMRASIGLYRLCLYHIFLLRLIAKRRNFAQIEDFNKQGGKSVLASAEARNIWCHNGDIGHNGDMG